MSSNNKPNIFCIIIFFRIAQKSQIFLFAILKKRCNKISIYCALHVVSFLKNEGNATRMNDNRFRPTARIAAIILPRHQQNLDNNSSSWHRAVYRGSCLDSRDNRDTLREVKWCTPTRGEEGKPRERERDWSFARIVRTYLTSNSRRVASSSSCTSSCVSLLKAPRLE